MIDLFEHYLPNRFTPEQIERAKNLSDGDLYFYREIARMSEKVHRLGRVGGRAIKLALSAVSAGVAAAHASGITRHPDDVPVTILCGGVAGMGWVLEKFSEWASRDNNETKLLLGNEAYNRTLQNYESLIMEDTVELEPIAV